MTTHPLIRVVVETVVFFATCSDEILDPDVAVAQLEAIASILNDLDLDSRRELLQFAENLADTESHSAVGSPERLELLRSLGDRLGLSV